MASKSLQPGRVQQMIRGDRRMFSASDDSAMMKQILATHSPDGRDVDIKPIVHIIEDILQRASQSFNSVFNGGDQEPFDALDKSASAVPALETEYDVFLEALAYIIHKISCELLCKCSGGADAHATTMAIFNMLANYSWDAKVVISLAAFAVIYGEFWLVEKLCVQDPLAKSVSLLKQLPDLTEYAATLKSRFEAINKLTKAMMKVTKCIVEFKDLPSQYISTETPPLSTAMAHVPTAAYWTIRSMVACASQITSLLGMSYEHITSTTEAWELSSLAHKVDNIYGHLKDQLGICYQHIDEKIHAEHFQALIRIFEMVHHDNIRVLKALIGTKDDMPLVEGTTRRRANLDELKKKTVLLLISDLDIHLEAITMLRQIYSKRVRQDLYEIVWLTVVDRTVHWNEEHQKRFEELLGQMPWYSVHQPTLLEPAVIRYIKEVWHFSKKLMLVVLDPQGKVVCSNALHMVWIWANQAHPFASSKEESLWKEKTWTLELLVDEIDETALNWISRGLCVCLYGGEDIDWIRKFTTQAKKVAQDANITLEMVYVGKSSAKEKVKKICKVIMDESLSHCWSDPIWVWYFWTRLESMLYSKMQFGRSIENDKVMEEVVTIMSLDGSDQGWALFSKGAGTGPDEIARSRGSMILQGLAEFGQWAERADQIGFVPALNEKLLQLHTPEHCNRLILPGIDGDIPEKVVCAECKKPMEKYLMYRCCND
ncbi:hypothetical protein NMG60_11002920 [Bertholletia excelsa]